MHGEAVPKTPADRAALQLRHRSVGACKALAQLEREPAQQSGTQERSQARPASPTASARRPCPVCGRAPGLSRRHARSRASRWSYTLPNTALKNAASKGPCRARARMRSLPGSARGCTPRRRRGTAAHARSRMHRRPTWRARAEQTGAAADRAHDSEPVHAELLRRTAPGCPLAWPGKPTPAAGGGACRSAHTRRGVHGDAGVRQCSPTLTLQP